jgi:hypothetical protein
MTSETDFDKYPNCYINVYDLYSYFTVNFSSKVVLPSQSQSERTNREAIKLLKLCIFPGAYFLQELVKKFDEMMQTPELTEDKSLDNVVNCLAHLYCFKVIFNYLRTIYHIRSGS